MARLILLNKPYGMPCQFRSEAGRPSLADVLDIPGVYPAGRLDADSEGLVVLTDDGRLQARISQPRFKLEKSYWVQVEGEPDGEALEALRKGLQLSDGPTLPARVAVVPEPPGLWPRTPPIRFRKAKPTTWLDLALREGRNRQVRRMTARVGLPTLRLIRHQVGPWGLGGLQPAQWREVAVSTSV